MIIETIISTMSKEKTSNISIWYKKKKILVLISPYSPSTTHTNMLENKFASISYTDNASIFKCIIKKKNFLMKKCT